MSQQKIPLTSIVTEISDISPALMNKISAKTRVKTSLLFFSPTASVLLAGCVFKPRPHWRHFRMPVLLLLDIKRVTDRQTDCQLFHVWSFIAIMGQRDIRQTIAYPLSGRLRQWK